MPQFDFTTLFSVTLSVAVGWLIYYSFFSINLLSEIITLLKFRNKLSEQNANQFLTHVSLPSVFLYKKLVKISKK